MPILMAPRSRPRACEACRVEVAREGEPFCGGCAWRAALGELAGALADLVFIRWRRADPRLAAIHADDHLRALDAIAYLLIEHAEARAQLEQAQTDHGPTSA